MNTSKKATEHLKECTQREREAIKYMVSLIEQDEDHINKCDREIKVFNNTDPAYPRAIKKQYEMQLRAKYILDCFGLKIRHDEDGKMTLTTSKEK